MARPSRSRAHVPGRTDVRSPVYGVAGGALLVVAAKLILDAGASYWGALKTLVKIDDRIEAFIVATFFVVLASLCLLYGYRFLRMIDRDWRREYLRLRAPRVRETRHTLHLVRKSPLTLAGIVVIALFIGVAALASVAPALIVPYPADGGAIYYRGEFFQPPFQRTQVWRNETIVDVQRMEGWYGWTDDERAIVPSPRRGGARELLSELREERPSRGQLHRGRVPLGRCVHDGHRFCRDSDPAADRPRQLPRGVGQLGCGPQLVAPADDVGPQL